MKHNRIGYIDKLTIIRRAALRAVLLVLVVALACPMHTYAAGSVMCGSGTPVDPIGDENAPEPDIRAKGAALYSVDMQRQVYGHNDDDRLDPYSTTKLLTCWLALRHLDPEQIVTVSEAATQTYENGTTIWLKAGEKIRVIDLIYGAMLESGNDAAYALGEAVSGSEEDFARLMNETISDWGCKDTHFVNANGWKNAEHYSTAHDMMIIAAKCLEDEELRRISASKTYTAPATNISSERKMKNYFLGAAKNAPGLTGGKSGTWDDDDCGLVASFSCDGLTEVLVILGDTDKGRPADVRKLMEFSHEVTPGYAVPAAGSTVEKAWVRHGAKTRLELASDDVTYAYPADNNAKSITTEAVYDRLEAPVSKGQEVGTFKIYLDGDLIGEHKLIAAEDIDVGWLPSYIYISNDATKKLLEVIGTLIVLLLIVRLAGRRRGISSASKRETRRRLREKYRGKH